MFKTPVIEQNYLQRSEAFYKDMRGVANPKDVYRWAREQIEEVGVQGGKVSYLPSFVGWTSSRMPTEAYVIPNDGMPYVHLIWNKLGQRWGLKAGPPEFTVESGPNDHYIQWGPGVYIWHEIKPENRTSTTTPPVEPQQTT